MKLSTHLTALVVATSAVFALPIFAVVQADDAPAHEDVTIQMNLTGTATRTDGGPDDGFTAYINVTGQGTRTTPAGNGVQVQATGLETSVLIVRNSDSVEVENFTALTGFHAEEASGIAQGLPTGSFKFNLELRGQRSQVIVGNADDNERVLAINANGDTVGAPDMDGVFMMNGHGQSTTQPDGTGSGATHYNIDLSGEGSTGSIA